MPPAFVHTGRLLGSGVPIVNRAHPLAQNLLAAYLPAIAPSGRIINLASPGSGDLTTRTGNAAASLAATPEGLGMPFTTTVASQASGPMPAAWQVEAVSLFARGKCNGQSGSEFFGGWICSIGTGYNWLIGQGATGASPGAMWVDHTNSSNNNQFTAGSLFNTGQMTSFGATFLQGSDPLAYVNGVPRSLSNVVAFNPTYPGSNLIYFGVQSTNNKVLSTLTIGYVWNRILTAQDYIYLDANPYALLLWPSDQVSLALGMLGGSGTAVRADAILAAEFLESLLSDSGIPEESLAIGSAVTGNAILPLEFSATVLRDWGAGAARSMIRRSSHPALLGRLRRLFFPGRPGTLAIESEGRQQADPGAPIEALGSGGNSVAGDAMSPIETAASQRRELGAAIENTARLQVNPGAPAEALAALLLDINSPVEALAGGITATADTNLAIEWVTSAPSILLSLESGPERVRLLATRGRVRLLRRK